MEYKTLGQLAGQAKASLEPVLASTPMTNGSVWSGGRSSSSASRRRQLSSVEEVEYGTAGEQQAKRADNSALSVRSPIRCYVHTA